MQKTEFYASRRAGLIVGGISLIFFLAFGLVFGFILDPYFGLLLWIMPVIPAVIGFTAGWLSAKWGKSSPLSPIKGGIVTGLSAGALTLLGWIIGIIIIGTKLKDIWLFYEYDLWHLILLIPLISMFTASWIGSYRKAESVNGKNIRLERLRKFLRHIFYFAVCVILFIYVGKQTINSLLSAVMTDRYYSHNRKFIYWRGKKITSSHGSSFKRLGAYIVRDKNFVYYRGRIIPGADTESFEVIGGSSGYSKDKNFIYQHGKRNQ